MLSHNYEEFEVAATIISACKSGLNNTWCHGGGSFKLYPSSHVNKYILTITKFAILLFWTNF